MSRADWVTSMMKGRGRGRPDEPARPNATRRAGTLSRGLLALMVVALPALATGPAAWAAGTQFRMGGDIHVAADQTLDSAVTLNGDITVEGVVESSAFTANGDIHVLPGGRVQGDAVSLTGRVLVDEGGTVLGERVEFGGDGIQVTGTPSSPVAVARNVGVDRGSGVGWFFFVLGAMGLGLLLVLLASGGLKGVGRELTARTGRSALVGLLSLMGFPVLFVVLLISVVGIPVALLLIPLVPLTAMFGIYALALVAGQRLLDLAGREHAGDVWAMLAGVALLGVATLVPVLGVLLWVLAGFFGLGATLSRLWEHYQDRRALRQAGRQAPDQTQWSAGNAASQPHPTVDYQPASAAAAAPAAPAPFAPPAYGPPAYGSAPAAEIPSAAAAPADAQTVRTLDGATADPAGETQPPGERFDEPGPASPESEGPRFHI